MNSPSLDSWIAELAVTAPWQPLFSAGEAERERRGYIDTLVEICQQPITWEGTAAAVTARADEIRAFLSRDDGAALRPLILTGSGSSLYVGECIAPALQAQLGVVARAVPAAQFLTHAEGYAVESDPPVVISFARSGDSPESTAVLDLLLQRYPHARHLVITCNAAGRLATAYSKDSRVMTIVLDRRTNDRSLVMTSSFTNMAIAGLALGTADGRIGAYRDGVRSLIEIGRDILSRHAADLARIARGPFGSACFLGAGPRFGAACEAALKMLEMSGGQVATMVETHLGLRHGPLAALREDTLIVASLPASPIARGYALDVIREIARKRRTAPKVIIGSGISEELAGESNVAVHVPPLDDGLAAVADVVVGQILAFFRCLAGGLRPDVPSPDGTINRVVPEFPIYR